jgi:hypothetical protein
MINILKISVVFTIIIFINSCSQRVAFGNCAYRIKTGECYPNLNEKFIADADILAMSYKAADALLNSYKNKHLNSTIIVSTIADINDLNKSSALGRLIGEQISARFTQKGFNVIESKVRQNLLVQQKNGEFILSRDLYNISKQHQIKIISSGTYAISINEVFITLKLLHINGSVLSSYAYSLPLGANTYALLGINN